MPDSAFPRLARRAATRYAFAVLLLTACNQDRVDTPRTPVARPIAVAYHGFLLDENLEVLENVAPAEADAFYQSRGWAANAVALTGAAPPPPPAGAPAAPAGAAPTAYMTECEKKGVPLPPPWEDPGWKKAGELPKDKIFAAPSLPTAEVWVFKTPLGICYALPRKDAKGEIQALGIICQGEESGAACFWDNIRADGTKITGAATAGMKVNDMQGGDVLKENCTGCHRGENVFIIHPGTPLQQTADSTGANKDPGDPNGKPTQPLKKPYKPIGQPGWGNEPSDLTLEADGCAFCHELPKLTPEYCRILKQSVGKTMPPPDGKKTDPSFDKDIKKLKDACNKLDPKLKW